MDNIGGIVSASYAIAENVKNCAVVGSKIIVSLPTSKSWKEIPATPGKIEITVTPGDESGLTLYTVAGTIYCSRFSLVEYGNLIVMGYHKILLKYVTGNGDVLVAGDKENPLTVKVENVNPAAANGYSGTKLIISGTMKHPELVLFE
jgi:hypothetical protein